MNLITREHLTGLRVVRAHNTQNYQEEKIDNVNKQNKEVNIFVGRMSALLWPSLGIIQGFTSLAMIYFGTRHINFFNQTGLSPDELMMLQQYSMRAIMSLMFITMVFIMIPRASVSANRIMEVLEMEPKIVETKNPVKLNKNIYGNIEFKNVTFKYINANEPVLTNISFRVKANKTTAIIGSTGSGKSTLINLIPRFYDVTKGEVLIDGINVKNLKFDDLYSLIGYVPRSE